MSIRYLIVTENVFYEYILLGNYLWWTVIRKMLPEAVFPAAASYHEQFVRSVWLIVALCKTKFLESIHHPKCIVMNRSVETFKAAVSSFKY
jgi:hypothetical protein